jgi:ketosteroid isomerase-like protein
VRRCYELGYATRDLDAVRELFADDFEWHQRREWPGRPVYRRDELPQLAEELDKSFSDFSMVPVEYQEVGDCVVVKTTTRARLTAGSDWVEGTVWHTWRIADGRATEVRAFTEREEALAAART